MSQWVDIPQSCDVWSARRRT